MLYPTLDSLIEKIGNRYLLVNVTAKRAREIAQEAANQGIRLTDKPVRLAVVEIAEGKYIYNLTEEQKSDMERLTAEELEAAEEAIGELSEDENSEEAAEETEAAEEVSEETETAE
ncbi:MAG: DNA-directed RNA polymerase subunit omega [Clostridia bacterium]|nr:DNA-directed RNA polymerase subunit omega [Clostridia bacterium]